MTGIAVVHCVDELVSKDGQNFHGIVQDGADEDVVAAIHSGPRSEALPDRPTRAPREADRHSKLIGDLDSDIDEQRSQPTDAGE